MRRFATSLVAHQPRRQPASVVALRVAGPLVKVASRTAGGGHAGIVTARVRDGLVLRLVVRDKSVSRTPPDERHAR